MPGTPCSPGVLRARIDRTKELIRLGPSTLVSLITQLVGEFGLSRNRCCEYVAMAEAELGAASPLTDDGLDRLFMAALLDDATSPDLSAADRRRAWELIARFRGRFRQVKLSDALVSAPPPPDLTNPAILDAALALDEAISAPKTPPA